MRVIIEKIISYLFNRKFPDEVANLAKMLPKLNDENVFPPFIYVFLNALRISGNLGAHQLAGSKNDVEAILPIFVRVVEWFLDKGLNKI